MAAIDTDDIRTRVLAWYEASRDDGLRPHLGASLIGRPCRRALWLSFRWVRAVRFDGRKLRLFAFGQQAEPRFVAELRAIGIEVHEADSAGRQFRVSDPATGGHFGGSMDGAALGLPEAPAAWHVLEFKTHNAKSFAGLARGVQAAKPDHYAQMQVYMGLTGMHRALYYAENKDDSDIYTERVRFDPQAFDALMAKARDVITAPEPPERISGDPSSWDCRWCDHHADCHGQAVPLANCRTCAHSTPELDGNARWSCAAWAHDIALEHQRTGCARHRFIPILLERIGAPVQASDAAVVYRTPEGGEFVNGDPSLCPDHLSSQDMHRRGADGLVS